jgi:hypothetical protein
MAKMLIETYDVQTGQITQEWVETYEPTIEEQISEKENMLLKIYAELEALKNKDE